jgi:hypothetical protein
MLLAFVPHSNRATISIIIPVIIAERQGISRGSVRTRSRIIRIIRKLLCPNNRTRISRGAITRMQNAQKGKAEKKTGRVFYT